MYRDIAVALLIIQISSLSTSTWAQLNEDNHKADIIMHSIGIPKDFYPQQLFKKFGSKYYYISGDVKISWYSAMHKCHSVGGHLISLTDSATLNEISKFIINSNNKYRSYWTDLNDLGEEGQYVSMTNGLSPNFVHWCENDTSAIKPNTTENCVHIDNTNASRPCMKSISCIDFQSYICESNIPRSISIFWH